ncbi:flagellar biosynthesis protein FlgJ [Paracoccus sp. 11-3]|uniref:Flagellar biosynthesis protein FlgJ n=2 Tax=Paracoccus amoyensis TaxID=2760093 RepID=A0A926J5G3_9RHOB|nr:flagellar biosynthesis protein FlgJ [Paracoccus amoyensis]
MKIESIGVAAGHKTPDTPVSEQLEIAFLEEMLKYCGPAARKGEFGGGIGEEQFSSYLTQEYAAILADKLDLGLAVKGIEA